MNDHFLNNSLVLFYPIFCGVIFAALLYFFFTTCFVLLRATQANSQDMLCSSHLYQAPFCAKP